MNIKKVIFNILAVVVVLGMALSVVQAEDGKLMRRNVSKTPNAETEQAAIYMMDFYVPAQDSTGVVGPVDNYILDDDSGTVAYEPRYYAKPLVAVYIDDIGEMEETQAGDVSQGSVAIGAFDAFVAISLDDGNSWRTTNLSNASDLSSFTLADGTPYPGDAHHVSHQVFGDNIFVAWATRYCDGGSPLFARKLDKAADLAYLTELETNYGKDALYLYDLFGVGGTQKSVDYAEQGFPEVGEIPYSCIWSARGKLLAGDNPATTDVTEATHVLWAKPERLTSGVRDANLPAVDCANGAGCILVWQEDPEGLRPGQGLGPGEGWSGAIANGKTDLWYSYISQADFDIVFADDTLNIDTEVPMPEYTGTTMPKVFVPMAMPTRLTDSNMCKATKSDPYCYIDFDNISDYDHTNVSELLTLAGPQVGADYCAEIVSWTNPGGTTLQICKTDDGRVLNGRVGSTRPRVNLKGYDTDGDGITDRAWVIMGAEETKALGDLLVDPYGNPTEDPLDIGKEMWYYTFDMFDHPVVEQGLLLSQPAVCNPFTVGADYDCEDYEFFPVQIDPLNGGEFYLTEISRRFALTTNSVKTIAESESGLSAILIYKQGIINQGGPADIMLRRTVQDVTSFDPAVDNPYDYKNLDCEEWVYTDGSNPNYLRGLCLSNPINISGTTIVRCDSGTGNDACAATFPAAEDGSIPDNEESFPKVYEWRNCDGVTVIDGCDNANDPGGDLDDYAWENPFDVAKGHRGFLDGDLVMMMYAWSPNWKSNSVGNDHYNLYVRRSFDGGATWTTTPAEYGGAGIVGAEENYYGTKIGEPVPVLWNYAAGAFEQARNVSLLTGNKVTILDPRYTPTGGLKLYPTIRTNWLTDNGFSFEGLPYADDLARDRSKFFVIYETGDNTTVTVGEATPLDLFYSRATIYGDVWEWEEFVTSAGETDYRWPWAEKDAEDLSGEASMLTNPGGTFMYAVWNQWKEEILPDGHELIFDSDMIFRRFLYLPDDSTIEIAPIINTLYSSASMLAKDVDDYVDLIVSARDLDKVGEGPEIVLYEWSVDGNILDGVTGNRYNAPARTLSNGWHGFSVRAKDNDGKWSKSVNFSVLIADTIYRSSMPMMLHP